MPFKLPELPYAYDALQPYMSSETLEYHHDKHHKTYVETANTLIAGTGLEDKSLKDVIIAAGRDPKLKKLFNNAAQHWNHSEFWLSMTPRGGLALPRSIEKAIDSDLGGLSVFKTDFVAKGVADFGSGWVWLVLDRGKLAIEATSDAENPLASGKTALLVCDVWEHAYYIDYRNGREKFLNAFVDHLIDWERVAELYGEATARKQAA